MAPRLASIKALLSFTAYLLNVRVSSGVGASGEGDIIWDVPNEALLKEVYAVSDAQAWNYVPNPFTAGVGGVSTCLAIVRSARPKIYLNPILPHTCKFPLQRACGYPLSPTQPPCGPENWGFLPNSSFCLPGRSDQTPINIDTISAPLPPASSQTDLNGGSYKIEYLSAAVNCQ